MNVTAPICSTGFGVVGLNLLKALDSLGAEPALFPIGGVDGNAWPEDHAMLKRCLGRAERFRSEAPSLRIWHPFQMAESIGSGRRMGYTFFELDRLKPVEAWHLTSLDDILHASQWAKDVAGKSSVGPRHSVIPPAVDTDIFVAEDLPQGDETIFMGAGKWEYRKGHDLVMQAFCEAFEPDDKVRLVMMCANPFLSEGQHQEWHNYFLHSKMGHKVTIIPTRVQSHRNVAEVMRASHCGVFPARAEGFNLEAAELLAMGRHVIMSDYSGHTQYGAEAGARMVPVSGLEAANDGIWFNANDPSWGGAPGKWASLNTAFLAGLVDELRHVHQERLYGQLGENTRGIEYFRQWTWRSAAERILELT